MNMKSQPPNAAHLAFRNALKAAVDQHGQTLDAIEVLAVLSHLVGQVVAMQDQRAYTPAQVMDLVARNVEQGNLEVIDQLLLETGGNA